MICQPLCGCELLKVSRLDVCVREKAKAVFLLREINFSLEQGEIHGLVGESGCGKSLFARTLVRLEAPARIRAGSILVAGCEVTGQPGNRLDHFRGEKISLVLQDPASAMDPVFTLASQFKDALSILPKQERSMSRVYQLLETVGIPSPELRCRQYPHEWSRGMLQRAQLVMALVSSPQILILDEVTSALDPTSGLQLIELIVRLRRTEKIGFILITHDLAMAAHVCDRISVMHQGTIVETQPTKSLFKQPEHSYTKAFVRDTGIQWEDLCLIR